MHNRREMSGATRKADSNEEISTALRGDLKRMFAFSSAIQSLPRGCIVTVHQLPGHFAHVQQDHLPDLPDNQTHLDNKIVVCRRAMN
jgi:Tfp pilus assembly protein PilO